MRWPRPRRSEEPPPEGFIGPDSMEVLPRRVRSGDTWCETLAVTGYPREVRPGWLQPLLAYAGAADIAIHVEPIPATMAAERLRRQIARFESSRRLDESKSKLADPSLEAAAQDAHDLAGRLARGEDRLFRAGLYVTVRAGSEEALDAAVNKVRGLCASLLLDIKPVTFRALQGFVSTLPLGLDALRLRRTFDTRALATTFPFASAEIADTGGILLGRNATSGSLVFSDRFALDSHNQVVLAQTGAGKSYLTKLMVLRSLFQGIEVLVIDPESEYERLANAVGGTVVRPGAAGQRLNPLDLPRELGDDALAHQASLLHAVCSILVDGISPEERTHLNRALLAANSRAGIALDPRTHSRPAPCLVEVASALSDEPAAQTLAMRLEPFVKGSFQSMFDGPTTVEPRGHLVVFSLRHLFRSGHGDAARAAGTLIALDAVWRRVRFGERRPRIVVVDEAWVLLQQERTAARFLADLAKSARKYWCGLTTVTQNVSDMLSTELGEAILTNATTQILLRQHAHAVGAVGDAFGLSQGERSYLESCPCGHGLYIAGKERAPLEVIASPEEHRLATSAPAELQAMEQAS